MGVIYFPLKVLQDRRNIVTLSLAIITKNVKTSKYREKWYYHLPIMCQPLLSISTKQLIDKTIDELRRAALSNSRAIFKIILDSINQTMDRVYIVAFKNWKLLFGPDLNGVRNDIRTCFVVQQFRTYWYIRRRKLRVVKLKKTLQVQNN